MVRARHSALTRAFALLVLLWAGFDIGAHGLLASDFAPMTASGSSISFGAEDSVVGAHPAPDLCFCHGISVGAVAPPRSAGLTPTRTLVIERSPQVPPGETNPLGRPPQPTV